MLWSGKEFMELNITVDMAICWKGKVVKRLRHFKHNYGGRRLQYSYHLNEQILMKDLPRYIRGGFILAKAVRIASIAQPDNIELFELQETIKTDDVISSFILKACLFV